MKSQNGQVVVKGKLDYGSMFILFSGKSRESGESEDMERKRGERRGVGRTELGRMKKGWNRLERE